jgi:long-chain acyl-CoA synthetase
VLARGGLVFAGYLNDPQRTAETLDADGWLHTGDIGTLDGDDYLRIIDRKKELLITAGGENVSPGNLEAALKTIPWVGEACVVGDRRPFIAALLTLDRETPMPAGVDRDGTLAAAIREAMAGFNHAEQVKRFLVLPGEWVPDSDELTPTAKLKRHAVEKKYAREIESLYAGGGVDTGL